MYNLEDHPSGIQEKIDTAIGDELEEAADGIDKLITFLDTIYAEDEMSEAWQKYKEFIRLKKNPDQPVNEFIAEFDKKHKRAQETGCEFSDMVLGFNLLESCSLSEIDEKFVLTNVDFKTGKQNKNLLDQIKNSLRKFQSRDRLRDNNDSMHIKPESAFVSNLKVALVTDGWTPPSNSGSAGHVKKNSTEYRGKKNPLDSDGYPLRCFKCDSEYHMSDRCDQEKKCTVKKQPGKGKKKKKKSATDSAALTDEQATKDDFEGTALAKVLARASVTDFNMLCTDAEEVSTVVGAEDKPMALSVVLHEFGSRECGVSEENPNQLLARASVTDFNMLCTDAEEVSTVVDAEDKPLALSVVLHEFRSQECGVVDEVHGVVLGDKPLLLSDLLGRFNDLKLSNVALVAPGQEVESVFLTLEEQELCLLIEEAGSRGVLDTACSRSWHLMPRSNDQPELIISLNRNILAIAILQF